MSAFIGMKVAKPGFDVKEARDNELILSSNYPLLKIHKENQGEITISSTTPVIVDIPHSIGKIPMYWVMSEVFDSAFSKLPEFTKLPYSIFIGLGQYLAFRPLPDADKLRLEFDPSELWSGTQTVKYYYRIFEDPIKPI